MKNHLNHRKNILALGALLIFATSFCAHGAGAETNAVPIDTVRKSVFNDDPSHGKDPFFPSSSRRGEKLPTGLQPVVSPLSQLSLKGISGKGNRRLALINNQPIGVGESAMVRISGGQVKVHCWEVTENTAVISIDGESTKKELRLREGL